MNMQTRMKSRVALAIWSFALIFAASIPCSYGETTARSVETSESGAHTNGQVPKASLYTSAREAVGKCATGGAEAWRKSFKEMIVDKYQYLFHASPAATKQFNEHCSRTP